MNEEILNKDQIMTSASDFLSLFCLMERTISEEIIIAKHDIQHLHFICENLSHENRKNNNQDRIPDFEKLRKISTNLTNLSEMIKNKFNDEIKHLRNQLLTKDIIKKGDFDNIVYEFNKLRIAQMKSLSIVSKELDYLHKTIAENCYSLPPMIDPIRRYKRKIDKDELTVLSKILKSYKNKMQRILELTLKQKKDIYIGPLIYIDYSASTKLFENPFEKIYDILDLKTTFLKENKKYNERLQGFIKLPYWAVKMTEYTSGIAHELVHLHLHLIELSENELNHDTNSITLLQYVNLLSKEVNRIADRYEIFKKEYVTNLGEEIIADLVSLFVAGPSYYFSLFIQGTARYVEEKNIIRSVNFMYVRILILEEIIERILKNQRYFFDEEFICYISKIERRLMIKKDVELGTNKFIDIFIDALKKLEKEPINTELKRKINKIIHECKNISENNLKECIEKIYDFIDRNIESDTFFILSKMLINSKKYIASILERTKFFAEGNGNKYNDAAFYNLLYGKYIIQDEIVDRIVEIIEQIFFKKKRSLIEKICERYVKNKYEKESKTKKKFELRECLEEIEPTYELLRNIDFNVSVEQVKIFGEDSKVIRRILEKVLNESGLTNEIMPEDIIRFNITTLDTPSTNKDELSVFDYSIIPEYLWEMTLRYFSYSNWISKRNIISDIYGRKELIDKNGFYANGETKQNASSENYCPDKRLLKLTVSRLLGVDIRRNLLLGKRGLKLDAIEEWLFAKVDWVKSYDTFFDEEKYKNKEGIVYKVQKEINKEIEKITSEKGVSYVDFILGDYDFLIRLPGASTRKDINWPPVKRSGDGRLKTYYSYREYIVEKIVLDKKETQKGSESSDSKKVKFGASPYLLQFIRFNELFFDNNRKNSIDILHDIIKKILENGYEVYLSNSWNEIFIKKILDKNDKCKNANGIVSDYKRIINNIIRKPCSVNEIIGDVQSYFVFPFDLNTKDCDFSNRNQTNDKLDDIKNYLRMRTILKTTGVVEEEINLHEQKNSTHISDCLKNGKNIVQRIDKINYTLGIMDYIIDWKPVASLPMNTVCDLIEARNLAMELIDVLATSTKPCFRTFSTLTSIIIEQSSV